MWPNTVFQPWSRSGAAVIYDTGISPGGTLHNMDVLGIDANEMQAIVLSHGDMDHTLRNMMLAPTWAFFLFS